MSENGVAEKIPDKQKRKLVLYFRGEGGSQQMDPFEFLVSAWAAHQYVTEGRSEVYNEVVLVSRCPEMYPKAIHILCPDIEYLDVSGNSFKRICSLGANTVHFTHGTSIENQFGSTPVLGLPIQLDGQRIDKIQDFVSLQLDYFKNNMEAIRDRTPQNPADYSGSIPGIIQETLRAIHESEQAMLEEAA